MTRPLATARTARAGLLLAFALFCPQLAQADRPVRVRSLEIEGVTRVPKGELADALVTSGPSWRPWVEAPEFDEAVLEEDLERVAGFYRERGFYRTRAVSELRWNAKRTRVRIRILVEEGPPVHLDGVEIVQRDPGRLAPERFEAVLRELPMPERGDVFGVSDYRDLRQALLDGLAEIGHPRVTLEGGADVDVDAGVAWVRWRVDPGPEVHFGEIEVEGLDRVEEYVVRRELRLAPGDRYALDPQRESREDLLELGLFRSVAIEPLPPELREPSPPPGAAPEPSGDAETSSPERAGGADAASEEAPGGADAVAEESPSVVRWPVVVRVQERKPRTVRLGGGYGTEERFRAQAAWRHRNFLGNARLLDLRLVYNALNPGFDAQLTQPHFLWPRVRLRLDGSLRYETMPAYEAWRATSSAQLERELTELWSGRVGYGFEIADVEHEDETADDGIERVSELRFGLQRDALDDRIEPRRGTWLSLSAAPAFEALGSTASWVQVGAEGRGFVSAAFATLGLRLRVAAIETFAGSRGSDVPVFKRLFSGGSTSVRGFKFQELGPLDGSGDPVGGRSLLEGSAELRFPIWGPLRGVGFVDTGLVDEDSFRYPLKDLRLSAGPGLRYSTPVGSIRFDLGFPLDRKAGEDSYRIHLAVGNAF